MKLSTRVWKLHNETQYLKEETKSLKRELMVSSMMKQSLAMMNIIECRTTQD